MLGKLNGVKLNVFMCILSNDDFELALTLIYVKLLSLTNNSFLWFML